GIWDERNGATHFISTRRSSVRMTRRSAVKLTIGNGGQAVSLAIARQNCLASTRGAASREAGCGLPFARHAGHREGLTAHPRRRYYRRPTSPHTPKRRGCRCICPPEFACSLYLSIPPCSW